MQHIDYTPGKITSYQKSENYIDIIADNHCTLRIYIVSAAIIRLRYAIEGYFEEDFSYAVDTKFTFEECQWLVNEEPHQLSIKTPLVHVFIQKSNLKIVFTDIHGKIINREDTGFHWHENDTHGGYIVKMSKIIQEGEHFYGLGDKTSHPNLRGKRVVNWAMDTYGFKKDEDPIYKAIPFFTSVHSGLSYGIFFDNTFKSYFDFGSERRSVASWWSEGGEMNYYFIYGMSLLEVVRQYTYLTGRPELPPLWALGYHQCKWSYYPESKVREITQKLRQLNIPCDVIYFDIDYMDGFRCFTWDKEKFPNPKKLIADLRTEGFKSIVIIDPGIKVDKGYSVFDEALEQNLFCRRADGPFMKGKVWPGECYFPDFTNPKARKWWSGLFKNLVEDMGVSGVWNDMNEPALFEIEGKTFPNDVRHDFDGHPCSHRKAHNVYGTQMARATYRGLKKFNENERPLVITRSAYAGAQRYAAAWTGDNIASWEHLWIANVQVQRMAMSGYSFVGSDIGGFIDHPTPELYVRWMQMAVFHPFCRTHSSGDHGDQEPWSFGDEALHIVRDYISLRYQLLPYLYTTMYHYTQYGTPFIRSIALHDDQDPETLYRADEFLCGDHILICPVLEPNCTSRYVYLPKGKWYNYWSQSLYEGGKEIKVDCPLQQIPMFIKEGAVIPRHPIMQYVGQKPIDILMLDVFVGGYDTSSYLYEDEGDGYAYQTGIYNKKKFKTYTSEKGFKLVLKDNGHYEPQYNNYSIRIIGWGENAPQSILLNESEIDHNNYTIADGVLIIQVPRDMFISLELLR